MIVDDVTLCSVSTGSTVKNVVENLTRSGLRLSLVCDSNGRLIGIVSDGDIRRGLLAGRGLDDHVDSILNPKFASAPQGTKLSELQSLAARLNVTHLPLMDREGRPTGLFIGQPRDESTPLPNTVVIMAGGKGMRLRPLTADIPKPMLHVGGKPIIQHIIEGLRGEGFRDFVFSINYLGEQIHDHFGDGSGWGIDISYVREREPLGTAGSLSLLGREFSEPLLVVNGDVFLEAKIADMLDFHNAQEADVTVGVKAHETQIPFGVVKLEGPRIIDIQEKPFHSDFVNAGVYVIAPKIIKRLEPGGYLDMPDLVTSIVDVDVVVGFPLHEDWLDLGRPEDLLRAENSKKDSGFQGDSP